MLDALAAILHDVMVELIVFAILTYVVGADRH